MASMLGWYRPAMIADWAKLPTSTPPGQVWMSARIRKPDAQNVAVIKSGGIAARALKALGANWAYWNGSKWQVDGAGPDKDLSRSDVMPPSYNQNGMPSMNGTGPQGGGGGGGNLLDALGGGQEPTIVQTRRCPGPMRLAINGLCYHKAVLPRALRMNKPRKAVVSYSEGRAILKGFNAAKKINRIDKKTGQAARRIAPKPRRAPRRQAYRPPRQIAPVVIDTD